MGSQRGGREGKQAKGPERWHCLSPGWAVASPAVWDILVLWSPGCPAWGKVLLPWEQAQEGLSEAELPGGSSTHGDSSPEGILLESGSWEAR